MNTTSNISAQGLELIAAFAKVNKVSRAKIEDIVSQVLTVQGSSAAPVARKRTKRDEYHAQIIAVAQANGGIVTRAELEKRGMKMVAFATSTLEAEGKIRRLPNATKVTAGRGRPSVTYQLVA